MLDKLQLRVKLRISCLIEIVTVEKLEIFCISIRVIFEQVEWSSSKMPKCITNAGYNDTISPNASVRRKSYSDAVRSLKSD